MRRLSYQSHPDSWKYLIVFTSIFVCSTARAETYRDTKNRYTLDLPKNWTLKPIFGRSDSARFERKLRNSKRSAWLKLTLIPAEAGDLKSARDAYHRREFTPELWTIKNDRSKAFRSEGLTRELGRSVRENVTQARTLHHLFIRKRGYWLSFELFTPSSRTYSALFRQVAHIVDSFTLLDTKASELETPTVATTSKKDIVGHWFRPPNESLFLRSNGQFKIESNRRTKRGTFEIKDGRLALRQKKAAWFQMTLVPQSNVLILKAEHSGKILKYTRRQTGRRSLIGQWTRKIDETSRTLTFHENGYFEYGRMRGRWSAEGEQFVLLSPNGSKLSYQFRFDKGFLIVSGGDFRKDAYFRKKRGS